MQLDGDNASEKAEARFVIRNNPKVVFVELYSSALSLVLFSVMVAGSISGPDGWFRRLILIFAVVYVLRVIYKPLSEWLLVELEVTDSGVTHTSGGLFRKKKRLSWNDIAMLDRDSDPIRGKLGGMKLSIVPVATKEDACELSFVASSDVDKVFETSGKFKNLNSPIEAPKQNIEDPADSGGEVVFRSLSKAEIFMLAIGYGESLLAVPVIASIVDNLPLLGIQVSWGDVTPWQLFRQLGVIVLAVMILGVLSTYLVYGKWCVTSYGQSLEIESGVFTQKRASFPLHKSVFTSIKEPIGLRLFQKAQIRSITPASGQATAKNVIVPILNTGDVPKILGMLGAPTSNSRERMQCIPLRVLAFCIGALLVFVFWFGVYRVFPQAPAILVSTIFLLLIPISKFSTTRISFIENDGGEPIFGIATYGMLNRTTQIADLREINSLSVWRIRLRGSRDLLFWRFRFIANGMRVLRGFELEHEGYRDDGMNLKGI